MAVTNASPETTSADDVAWNLDTLLTSESGGSVDELLDAADAVATRIEQAKGTVAEMDVDRLVAVMNDTAELYETLGRASSFASLRFAADTAEPEHGALMQRVQERSTAINTRLVFFDLEWAALEDSRVEQLLGDPRLSFCAHHLRSSRRYRDHLLTEPEEQILTEKSVSGRNAWTRLFTELTSDIEIEVPAGLGDEASGDSTTGDDSATIKLESALPLLMSADADVRRIAAAAITEGLEPGLRTRAFVFNTLLNDKATDDRLRSYPSWITSRNKSNEASDESVQALVDAVQSRYDIPQRWYRMKADMLGVERLADYDRMASIADPDDGDAQSYSWATARELVLDSYGSFSPELADIVGRFFDEQWIDAPIRSSKRPGAFCSYTVPSHHPYILLNWAGRRRDVLTLAHELGHGLHGYLAREQGVFHQMTPLTLAETASVFGETVTFDRLLAVTDEPGDRLQLLAESLEGAIATVFRQTAMNRFEDAVHTARRDEGELSVERFGDLWVTSQEAMLGDGVEVTDGYRSWWSYIPHFISTPGYVYAYAYGQLLALSVYKRYAELGGDFVPAYLELLRAGGSKSPEELGAIVDCDLADPTFWDGGLTIIEGQLNEAEAAAKATGRL